MGAHHAGKFELRPARVARDGATALALAQLFLPEVAFLDIGMPGMKLQALLRELAQPAPR